MKANLSREGGRTVAEHVFESEVDVPTVWVEAPRSLGVFHTAVEWEVMRDMRDHETLSRKSPIAGDKTIEKPKKCGICKVHIDDYEVHIESQEHAEHVRELHEDYAKLDELMQEYRYKPAHLAPVFQQSAVKRKSADRPEASSQIKMAKTIRSSHADSS